MDTRHALRIAVGITMLALLLAGTVEAIPEEEWNRTLTLGNGIAYSVRQTLDDGYIVVGANWENRSDFIIKTNATGAEQWYKTFGETAFYGHQTLDGGYIVAGSETNIGNGYLVKTANNGNLEWMRGYGGDYLAFVQQTLDGGYITGGILRLFKTDSYGIEEWNWAWEDGDFVEISEIHQTSDGGYVFGMGYFGKLVKTDINGIEQWNISFMEEGAGDMNSVKQTSDGGYIIGDNGGVLIKTDANGIKLWNRTLGRDINSDSIEDVEQTKDGGYIFAGMYTGFEALVGKTDANGNEQWNMTKPGRFQAVQQSTDGGYILAGFDSSFNAYLVKLSSEGSVHNINKGITYTTIQSAIDDANPGDEIHVDSGMYYENVNVNKQLTLLGVDTGSGRPVVDARGSGSAITLATDGIVLEGFIATGSSNYYYTGAAGIKVISNNNTLSNNNASNNDHGIDLSSSDDNMLSGNNASNNDYGINLSHSNNNTLSGNNAKNNQFYGILLYYSGNNTLSGNNATNSMYNGYGGIRLEFSSNNTLIDNNATNNGMGIILSYSSNNTLSGNIASNNAIGIYLESFSNNNTLSRNNASNNDHGIILSSYPNPPLDYYSNNIIYNNYFNNTNNLRYWSPITINSWNTTKIPGTNIIGGFNLGGNFWANPSGTGFSQTCTNTDGDGICDSPYVLDANNTDYMPLTSLNTILPSIRFINGIVKDNSSGNSLPGVRVSANSTLSTTSNATGFYSFAVTNGTYNLVSTINDIRFYTNTTTVSTTGQAVVIQDIEMIRKPIGNITGIVTR